MLTGADHLVNGNFARLAGERVGLITNQTGVSGGRHLIDLLHEAENVDLVALFGPEHGLRGQAAAGEHVSDATDSRTGLPIYSLYGTADAPSGDVLDDLDVLVFDIQDIGARFYTYITTMGHAMVAAAEAGIRFVVLDRPNPLGGTRVDGYVLDMEFSSGVGPYPIPIQHGMTVGELALLVKGERFRDGLDDLDLEIIEMTGWNRDMLWPDTGLDWIPTSPNIPTFETALVYLGTCFFEATTASEGRGTDSPFLTVGAPWLDTDRAVSELRSGPLPGVSFTGSTARPVDIVGAANDPKFEDETINTIEIAVEDVATFEPLLTGISLVRLFYELAPESDREAFINTRWMALLSGGNRLAESLSARESVEEIAADWHQEVGAFRQLREPYLIYD